MRALPSGLVCSLGLTSKVNMARGKVFLSVPLEHFHPELKYCGEDDDSWVRLEELLG